MPTAEEVNYFTELLTAIVTREVPDTLTSIYHLRQVPNLPFWVCPHKTKQKKRPKRNSYTTTSSNTTPNQLPGICGLISPPSCPANLVATSSKHFSLCNPRNNLISPFLPCHNVFTLCTYT